MNDLISRAALFNSLANVKTLEEAFAVIQRIPAVPTDKGFIPRESAIRTAINLYHKCDTGSLEDYRDMMIEALEVLAGMPLPERWIPCAERLPENDKPVLVTLKWADDDLEISTGEYWRPGGWGTFEGFVIAWRELPEPWKGEE